MAETRWTPLMVEARFEEAASTLRRLPDTRVPGYFNTWPPIVRSVYEAFGWERARMPKIAPTPDAIGRMEETFTWLAWLEPDDARIVWMRAEGERWKPICWKVGLSRQHAWRGGSSRLPDRDEAQRRARAETSVAIGSRGDGKAACAASPENLDD